MIQKLPLFILAFVFAWHNPVAAQDLQCGTTEKMQQQLAADPSLADKRQQIETFTQKWIEKHADNQNREVITIPVVVHVVYKTSAQNISDAQIQSQIDVLNEDFSATNDDITGVPSVWIDRIANTDIQFALAAQDPDGFLTNGITRTQTTVSDWGGSDNVKYTAQGGKDAWPNTDYLNIWVCNIGSGLLGYAYQPGINAALDGVVVGYRYFGRVGTLASSYNQGRTTTHEVAHYLNLDHLWGSYGLNSNCTYDDNVADTPKQQGPNYGCNNTFPKETCGTGVDSDMFNNYMDYGNDACLFFFTEGQKNRMLATLNGPRASIKTSNALTPGQVGIAENILQQSLQVYPNPTRGLLTLHTNAPVHGFTHIEIRDVSGRTVYTEAQANLSFAKYTLNLSELTAGMYVLQLTSDNEQISRKINITH